MRVDIDLHSDSDNTRPGTVTVSLAVEDGFGKDRTKYVFRLDGRRISVPADELDAALKMLRSLP